MRSSRPVGPRLSQGLRAGEGAGQVWETVRERGEGGKRGGFTDGASDPSARRPSLSPKFERPRRFEVYRANPQGIGDLRILVLSDDVPNALRSVVIACSLDAVAKGMNLKLPTYVVLRPEETGLDAEIVASPASPFTLPKNSLVQKSGSLPRAAQRRVDMALRLAFGYEEWPI